MLKIYDVPTAQLTILKRKPLELVEVPPAVQERTNSLFGETLTPAQAVGRILADVRARGDDALRHWSGKLDGAAPASFRVPKQEIETAQASLPTVQRQAFEEAARRIEAFHRKQPLISWLSQDLGGALGQLIRPIRRVGLYVPGGTAPLPSSVLMSVIPAKVAGVSEIAVMSPPQQGTGKVAPIILAAAAIAGVSEVYALGGAQAIAALAYGTPTIPRVDKILGPGNLFVTLAKQQVYGTVGIDALAGPTETVVIADDTARSDWVALDLLAQAEHDVLASAILLTPSRRLAEAVQVEVTRLLSAEYSPSFSRLQVLQTSLPANSGVVITGSLEEAVALSNAYAPEHLNIVTADPWRLADQVTAAGGIFLGEHSFEVLGDYAAGPSHIMPTGGSARFASPLNVWDFIHIVSLIALNPTSAPNVARTSAVIARAEGLDAHARAAEARLV
jgi:histidinol dehydrogenase